eukprot:scaffold206280_cov28-Tisochrysis_lutea.AAC.1
MPHAGPKEHTEIVTRLDGTVGGGPAGVQGSEQRRSLARAQSWYELQSLRCQTRGTKGLVTAR